jgi:hypothetical protein
MKKFTIEEISQTVNGTLTGNPTILITGVEQISEATKNQLTFIGDDLPPLLVPLFKLEFAQYFPVKTITKKDQSVKSL